MPNKARLQDNRGIPITHGVKVRNNYEVYAYVYFLRSVFKWVVATDMKSARKGIYVPIESFRKNGITIIN